MTRWIVAGILLLVISFTLQLHFIVWAVLMMVVIWRSMRHVSSSWINGMVATRECSSLNAEVGDRVQVKIDFTNKGRWPILWALVEDLMFRGPAGLEDNFLGRSGDHAGVLQLGSDGRAHWEYQLRCRRRGYYQLGPLVMETGDVFGIERRYRVLAPPVWLLVRPEVILLSGYDIQSRRPIGEIVMTHRLFEDPTRTSGVRKYQAGDPMNRVHWRASARTGELHSRVFESTSMAGGTIVVDFHVDSFENANEPVRSELSITAAASIANLLYEMNQQSGLMSNGRDGAGRVREEGWRGDGRTRDEARASAAMSSKSDRLQPVLVPTGRASGRLSEMLDQLARLELSDGLTLDQAMLANTGRLPRDATIIAIVSRVNESTALALQSMRRQGYAVTAIVNRWNDEEFLHASGLLVAHSIGVCHLKDRDSIPDICRKLATGLAFA